MDVVKAACENHRSLASFDHVDIRMGKSGISIGRGSWVDKHLVAEEERKSNSPTVAAAGAEPKQASAPGVGQAELGLADHLEGEPQTMLGDAKGRARIPEAAKLEVAGRLRGTTSQRLTYSCVMMCIVPWGKGERTGGRSESTNICLQTFGGL